MSVRKVTQRRKRRLIGYKWFHVKADKYGVTVGLYPSPEVP